MIADLPGADLSGADFSGAMVGVNIKNQGMGQMRTDLSNANLSKAVLAGADFNRSLMTFCDLRGANLRGANFFRVKLGGADLTGADVTGANFAEADLEGVRVPRRQGLRRRDRSGQGHQCFTDPPLKGSPTAGSPSPPGVVDSRRVACAPPPPTKTTGDKMLEDSSDVQSSQSGERRTLLRRMGVAVVHARLVGPRLAQAQGTPAPWRHRAS